jgi:hypothetical protein
MYQGKMADFDREDWIEEVDQADQDRDYRRIDRAPDDSQLLGPWKGNLAWKTHNMSNTDCNGNSCGLDAQPHHRLANSSVLTEK